MKVPNTRQSMSKRRVSFAPEATLHTFELVENVSFTEPQVAQPVRKRDSGVNKELASIFLMLLPRLQVVPLTVFLNLKQSNNNQKMTRALVKITLKIAFIRMMTKAIWS